jgi:hypothetical protein
MEPGSIGRTLRRSGAVSAGALFIALAGGGLSLAGAVPGSAGNSALPAVSSPHDGGLLHGQSLPTVPPLPVPVPVPLPAPAPVPTTAPTDSGPLPPTVTKTVHKTVKTVQGLLGGGSGGSGGSQGGSGGQHGGSRGSHPGTSGHQPGSKTPDNTKSRPPTRSVTPGGVYRVPMRRVDTVAAAAAPRLANHANVAANVAAAGAPAAVPPQLAPTPSLTQPPIVSIGQRSLPAAIVAIAIAAFAALAASHVGVWQNRVRRSL